MALKEQARLLSMTKARVILSASEESGSEKMRKQYYVYIITNRSGTLYTGVTNNLERRIREHKSGNIPGFARRYRISRLVFYEETTDIASAIQREKQIKGWLRKKKVALIESMNPDWRDLSEEWYQDLRNPGRDSSSPGGSSE